MNAAVDLMLLNSLDKVFYDERPQLFDVAELNTVAPGDTFSFQAAVFINGEHAPSDSYRVETVSGLGGEIKTSRIRHVPSLLPKYADTDGGYLRGDIGMYPDVLEEADEFILLHGKWNAIWIAVALPVDHPPGEFGITVKIKSAHAGTPAGDGAHVGEEATVENGTLAEKSTKLKVARTAYDEAPFIHTEWFHTDCLAQYYGVEVFSDEYWRIVENFMAAAADMGINMLLTPVVTPPLDTVKGGERLTVQLVDIYERDNGYSFGFDKLGRWIDIARSAGIEYFEIAHLFTQWGAENAPKIIVKDSTGKGYKKFGWETDAAGDEYAAFLNEFIPALRAYLNEKGAGDKAYYHISDEPGSGQIEQYKRARAVAAPLLEGCKVFDALSDPEFYEQGIVDIPIIAIDHYESFESLMLKERWVYYCCGQSTDVANRFFALPSARNRILGVQLYIHDITGFLQWGFNFYNSCLSKRPINPYETTDADMALPSGDSFIVYPGEGGHAVKSMRYMVFKEAMSDYHALKRLERLAGKDYVVDLISRHAGCGITFKKYPRSGGSGAEFLIKLKAAVLDAIDNNH